MNPRILKKLSKRVVATGLYNEGELYTETDRYETTEYAPAGASRKPAHRNERYTFERPRDRHRMGDMRVLRGTPGVWWSSHTDCGTEYDSANAWAHAERDVIDEIMWGATDWDDDGNESWLDGKPPKYPRSTPAMLRAIERQAAEKKRRDEEQRLESLRWRARLTA